MSQTMPKKTLHIQLNTLGGNLSLSTLKIHMYLTAIFTFIIPTESMRKIGN